MAGETHTTTDHATIKQWTEDRGGHPATVKQTAHGDEAGILRIDFPGYSGDDKLEEISWDEFFAKFDDKQLVFLYQEHTSSGEESRFFKFVNHDSPEHTGGSHSSEHTKDTHKGSKASHKH